MIWKTNKPDEKCCGKKGEKKESVSPFFYPDMVNIRDMLICIMDGRIEGTAGDKIAAVKIFLELSKSWNWFLENEDILALMKQWDQSDDSETSGEEDM